MLAPGKLQYSFFCNSGTESVEGALKLARAYDVSKPTIVVATRALSRQELRLALRERQGFVPRALRTLHRPDPEHVPFNDIAALEDTMQACRHTGDDVGAVLLETHPRRGRRQ